jgi:hypothetical protein
MVLWLVSVWMGWGDSRIPWLVCGEGSREHPFGSLPDGLRAMTVIPGTGLLSQVSERRVAGSCDFASSPGAW